MLNGQDDKDRVVYYEYSLVYGMDGRVDETNPVRGRLDLGGGRGPFAPLNVLQVVESRWGGHNPQVTEANVRSIDMANGGSAIAGGSRARPRISGRSPSTKRAVRR